MQLGALIKSRRREKGLTQEELAERLGVSQQALGRWELGAQPRPRHLRALAEILELPEGDVVKLADQEPIDVRDEMTIAGKLDQALRLLAGMNDRLAVVERELGLVESPTAESVTTVVSTIPGYLNLVPQVRAREMANAARQLEGSVVAS